MAIYVRRQNGVILAIETIDEVFDEIQVMIKEHYEEVAAYKDKIKLDPDWFRYLEMQDEDRLVVFTMRRDGILVGYNFYFLDTHIHYSNDIFAVGDVLFVAKEHRGIKAVKFLDYCEEMLKEMGVSVITMHMKVYASFERLAEHCGYDFMEKIYTKCIKD